MISPPLPVRVHPVSVSCMNVNICDVEAISPHRIVPSLNHEVHLGMKWRGETQMDMQCTALCGEGVDSSLVLCTYDSLRYK